MSYPLRQLSKRTLVPPALLLMSLGLFGVAHSEPVGTENLPFDTVHEPAGADIPMALFPSAPIPGHPGADPAAGRPVWDMPEYVNYPGSVEHYRMEEGRYIAPKNPFNYRSLIKNFVAVDLPGVPPALKESFAEPVQYVLKGSAPGLIRTGQKRPPVSVVRLHPGGRRLAFHLDPLPIGMYVVRVIGAVETKDVADIPKDLILDLNINDGPHGEINHYVLRQNGTDNFYALGDFYFHVEDGRAFNLDVGLHSASAIDLLVHNVDVHDVLAECAKRAGKKQQIVVSPEAMKEFNNSTQATYERSINQATMQSGIKALRVQFPDKTDEELTKIWRAQRDEVIWNAPPPINSYFISRPGNTISSRADPATQAMLKAKGLALDNNNLAFGNSNYREQPFWRLDTPAQGTAIYAPWRLSWKHDDGTVSYYTLDDLRVSKPLPGLPFEVYPWGKRFEVAGAKPAFLFPQAQATSSAFYRYERSVASTSLDANPRERALLLCRMAYDLPSYEPLHDLSATLTPPNEFYWRYVAHQQQARTSYQFIEWQDLAESYDNLFPFIKDNRELATAVGRFIPWVKTPDDVIKLLDTYILQFGAKQIMYFRHYYSDEQADMLAKMAAIQNDPQISKPWIDYIFSRTWEYPYRQTGIKDYLYLSVQRDGTEALGSSFYAQVGGIGMKTANWLDYYIEFGGDPQYNLSDPKLFPRVFAALYFNQENRVAGLHFMDVGDVNGPSVMYGQWFDQIVQQANLGWRWTKDPRFAYELVHYGKRVSETDTEWAEIEAAAKTVTRNPFMANRSRVLSDWGGILEGGTQSDDFRFRQAARVRVGMGWGHSHMDSLDLGIWSLGLIMSGDTGGRGGYGRPAVEASSSHNVATIDGRDWQGHTWIPELADLDGCQYLRARGDYGAEFSRQVALIEADHGRAAAKPPSNPDLRPGTTYDNDIVLPHAYYFDVFRTAGGKQHAYNFHGPTDDEFTTNVTPRALTDEESKLLSGYVLAGKQWGGDIPAEGLTATWRMARDKQEFDCPGRGHFITPATEPSIMGAAYDPNSPRKYLCVHLPGQAGARMLTGQWIAAPNIVGRTDGETFRQVHVLRPVPANGVASSLFAAIWEPYAGQPFIKSVRQEALPTGTPDANSYAALHVETVDGANDLCFADQASAPSRTLEDGTTIQASYAYLSHDADGLRQVDLVGGKSLQTKTLTIKPAVAEWEGKVLAADYLNKHVTLEGALPARVLDGAFFEVGAPAQNNLAAHWTNFEALKVTPQAGKAVIEWRKGADMYSGRVTAVAAPDKPGAAAVLTVEPGTNTAGENSQLTLIGETPGRQWRCTVQNDKLTLYGQPLKAGDFKVGSEVSFYEFGPGDVWRVPSKVELLRQSAGIYKLQTNAPCELTLASTNAQWSSDGKRWMPLPSAGAGHQLWRITREQLGSGTLYLKWSNS